MSGISKKRIKKDIAELKKIAINFKIHENKSIHMLLEGPKDTVYEKGIWEVIFTIPEEYPFKSPSVGFYHKIYHPNIDEESGSVCLDVINQMWSPMYSLKNIYDTFLPQLLTYPNAEDPLNIAAANLYIKDSKTYEIMVKQYIRTFCPNYVI